MSGDSHRNVSFSETVIISHHKKAIFTAPNMSIFLIHFASILAKVIQQLQTQPVETIKTAAQLLGLKCEASVKVHGHVTPVFSKGLPTSLAL